MDVYVSKTNPERTPSEAAVIAREELRAGVAPKQISGPQASEGAGAVERSATFEVGSFDRFRRQNCGGWRGQ